MILTTVSLFLFVSLILYILLGGADYGGGIVELFRAPKKGSDQVVSHAMGPVWEANHIWLVLVVVILFVGFPHAYAVACTSLHIPLVLALGGIVLRGTAFTFRAYDAIQDKTDRFYGQVFKLSSLITPFWLGVIAASLFAGKIDLGASDYYDLYVRPWLGFFQFSVGLFTISLCGYLASVYLVGEEQSANSRRYFQTHAKYFAEASYLFGALVFLVAYLQRIEFLYYFIRSPLSLACIALGTLSIPLLWQQLRSGHPIVARVVVASQVGFILVGWFAAEFPVLIRTAGGDYSITALAAPEATLRTLLFALVVGLVLVVPAFLYLLLLFKKRR